jgi:HSP20 family molecular chaperone IbpA
LWIRGSQKQEEKNEQKKYYRKAASSFSYRVAVPGDIDENKEPEVTCKNGVIKTVFAKRPEIEPKKLTIKSE